MYNCYLYILVLWKYDIRVIAKTWYSRTKIDSVRKNPITSFWAKRMHFWIKKCSFWWGIQNWSWFWIQTATENCRRKTKVPFLTNPQLYVHGATSATSTLSIQQPRTTPATIYLRHNSRLLHFSLGRTNREQERRPAWWPLSPLSWRRCRHHSLIEAIASHLKPWQQSSPSCLCNNRLRHNGHMLQLPSCCGCT